MMAHTSVPQISPRIWVLADDRAGNVSQVMGVAEALGIPFEVKTIRYTKQGRWPNLLRGASLRGVDAENSSKLEAPWPDIILSAGRKTVPVGRYIKKQSGGHTKLVQLMWPGIPHGDCDLIITPKHDGIAEGGTIHCTFGAPNRITKARLETERTNWEAAFSHLEKPYVALLVGGTTKKGVFTRAHAEELASKVNQFMAGKPGTLLITNSRRTGEEATQALKQALTVPCHFHDVQSSQPNPYFGYLALADAIIATGDSISMCSEACTSGKPVYLYAPEELTPDKHQAFHRNLYAQGYAQALDGTWQDRPYTPLSDAADIAALIREKYCKEYV